MWSRYGNTVTNEMVKKQCRYCEFYDVDQIQSLEKTSCKIDMIINIKNSVCLSFRPNMMFGICCTCKDYCWCSPPTYCFASEQPNKHRVYPCKVCEFDAEGYFTCDNYQVGEGWKNFILANLTAGRCPYNFDPYTWEAIDDGQAKASEVLARFIEKDRPEPEFKTGTGHLMVQMDLFSCVEG